MAMDFAARRKEAEKAGLIGSGDYFKIKEGANRFRLLTECLPHNDTFNGQKNFRWLCYVTDRRDSKVKAFFMPHTVYKQIEALQTNEDYAFDDVPMPYDVTISATAAGTKEAKYVVLPAKNETPVTALEHQQLAELKPLKALQDALFEKKKGGRSPEPPPHDDDGEHGIPTDDDVPFGHV